MPWSEKAWRAKREAEANLFARCLLMPESMIRKAVKADKIAWDNDDEPVRLAKMFDVPATLMVIRLAELGFYSQAGERL